MSITPNPDASFTPTRGHYTDLKPFRFWCQKVLPLVYDDSLSYYELLCKVVDYLNKTMEDVETLEGDITAMYTAYEQLQNYVNTYFDSLDVQEEINNKLDAMAASGALLTIIQPSVTSTTEGWLTQHITNPSNPPIDTSLTIAGAAADAKATGDAISDVRGDLTQLEIIVEKTIGDGTFDDFVIGNLDVNGALEESTTRIVTKNYHRFKSSTTIIDLNTIKRIILCLYNNDYSLRERTLFRTETVIVPENTLFRIAVYTDDETAITNVSEIADNMSYVHENTVNDLNITLDALNKQNKKLLSSAYRIGGLNAAGEFEPSYDTRVVFYQYMKSNNPLLIAVDYSYTMCVCLYNEDHTLISRTLYPGESDPQATVPSNTLFRVFVYKTGSTDVISDPTPFAEAVYTPIMDDLTQLEIIVDEAVGDGTFDDFVIGNLNANGDLEERTTRVVTKNYHRFKSSTTIINLNTIKRIILCLYNDDCSLRERTLFRTETVIVPENTLFRIAVYTDDETAITNVSEIADNMSYVHENTVNDLNITLDALNKSKKLLSSSYRLGGLNAAGEFIPSYDNRVVFYQYMKSNNPLIINVDYLYTMCVCLYNEDHTLISRTLYPGETNSQAIIPSNTLFRIFVYKTGSSDVISDPTPFVEAVYASINMNELANVITIFESFAVIGDSLSCGYVGSQNGNISSNTAREAGRNWVHYLSLNINRPFTNLARGSSSAHDWRYGNTSLDVNIATADIDTYCYMVAIGVNDARQNLPVGVTTDIATNKENNADTFYGNYDYLIRQLIEYKNNRLSQAKIFVFTMPATEENAENYNAAIRYVANQYDDVTCVDLYNLFYEKWLTYPFAGTWVSNHSRPIGYAMMADMIRKGVNLEMTQNIGSFLLTPWELP